MANKYLDGAGLDHTWGKIKSYLGNNYAAKSHTHTASQITDLDSKFGVNLIEKRVVTTSGAVSIPAGTRAIAYVGIGGGGGGGGGGWYVGGGGGGGGGAGNGTAGGGGAGAVAGKPGGGGNGGVGGKGELGFLYNFVGLSISAVIGAGGAGGAGGNASNTGGTGKAGGKSYVNVTGSSTVPISIFPDKTTLNKNGNAGAVGSENNTGGAGGTALTALGISAGAGGKGGGGTQKGSAGGKGAVIFFFYS